MHMITTSTFKDKVGVILHFCYCHQIRLRDKNQFVLRRFLIHSKFPNLSVASPLLKKYLRQVALSHMFQLNISHVSSLKSSYDASHSSCNSLVTSPHHILLQSKSPQHHSVILWPSPFCPSDVVINIHVYKKMATILITYFSLKSVACCWERDWNQWEEMQCCARFKVLTTEIACDSLWTCIITVQHFWQSRVFPIATW